jgi:hypothetical protein
MKTMAVLLLWLLLFFLCWPLALAALLILPILWLLLLPFRLVFIVVEALLAFVRTILFLPARMLGWKS